MHPTDVFSEATRAADVTVFGIGRLLTGLASNSVAIHKEYMHALHALVRYSE
jgi:hypothetical protein